MRQALIDSASSSPHGDSKRKPSHLQLTDEESEVQSGWQRHCATHWAVLTSTVGACALAEATECELQRGDWSSISLYFHILTGAL